MIWILYGCLILGAGLLLASGTGRLTADPGRVRGLRALGLVAASGPGLGPLVLWVANPTAVVWPYPVIAIAYVAMFVMLAVGVLSPLADAPRTRLRRVGYVGMLLLGALPSFVLLLLAPAILLAGLTLIEPRATATAVE